MKKIFTFLMAFGLVLLSSAGWGQYAINFDGASDATSGSSYGFTDHDLNGITWTGVQVIIPTSPLDADWYNGVRSARLRGYSTSHMTMTSNKGNGIGTISFKYRRYGTDSQVTWKVEYSTNEGGSWSQVGSDFTAPANDIVQEFSETVNILGNVRIRIIHVSGGASSNKRLNIDDLLLTDYTGSPSPSITVSPSSLTGFIYLVGNGPSAEQLFTIEGSDLSADIVITPPTNYEISETSGSNFAGNAITLTQSGGTVSSTTIYVRLEAGLTAGTYDEDITCTSTDATNKTVSLSGSVVEPNTTTLPYSEDFSSGFGDTYTYTVAGSKPWAIVTGGAQANGFSGENPEEHWLVMPGIDFNAYSDEVMTFTNFAKYGTIDANNYLKLFYSSDYPGLGDPTSYTWNELSFDQPAAGSVGSTEIETPSGIIDLSAIVGENVYLAFKYYSTDNPTSWRIDDILIYEDQSASEPTNHPTDFLATANSSSEITLSWIDAVPAADGYLIKGSDVGYASIVAPVDGTPEANGVLIHNVASGIQSHQFTGLNAETTYYFKIFPYNGLETTVNYKTDGAPQDDATTLEGVDFIVVDFDDVDNWTAGSAIISSYATDHTYVDGVFSSTGGPALRNTTSTQDGSPGAFGSYSWRLSNTTDVEWTITIASGGVGIFEVDVRRWDGSPSPDYNLDYSVDGGNNWSNVTNINNTSLDNSSDWKTFSGTINHTASNIMIRFIANGSTERIMIDNFKWTTFEGEATTNWMADASSSEWNDPNNWSNGLPGTASDVIINSGTNDPLLQSASTIQSLTINSGATLNIGASGQLSVTGTLTNNAGNSGLYVHSDASGTGSLIHNTDNVPFTIERYVTGGENAGGGTSIYKYHLISIPLADGIQAGDVFTGSYLWHFVPNQTNEDSWLGITSLTENLDNQKGFLSYVADESDKFIFTGTMNNGDFTVAAENIDAGNVKLIPNPYPSAIDWEAIDLTGTGLNPTIWLFNSNTGNYESYNDGAGLGQQYIPVGQAVFVEAASADPSLTFTNAHRTHNQGNGFYKSGGELAKDLLKIAVSANSSSDATFIRFRQQAENTYNGFDDASKLKGFSGAPQLYTHSTDNRDLSINTLATSQETVIVPLSFELNASGEAVMSFEYLETFEPEVDIYLEDLLTDQMINIRETGHYTFSHEVENDPLRFNLHFMGVTSVQDLQASENHFKVWTNENQLYILPTDKLTEGSLQIELFDLSGRLIQSVDKQAQKPMILSIPDYKGIMLVRIQNEKLVQTQKIFIR